MLILITVIRIIELESVVSLSHFVELQHKVKLPLWSLRLIFRVCVCKFNVVKKYKIPLVLYCTY